MRTLNSEWNKRLIAGLLAIAMLSSIMPPVVMAEDTTEQNDDTELLLEVDALDADATMKTTGETTEATEETTEATEETTEATTGATTSDSSVVEVESLLSMPMMLLSEGETVTDGETQPVTVDTQATVPTLSLKDAGLSSDNQGVVVNSVDALILLSNVYPSEYQNQTITLSLTKDYDWSIGGSITHNDATYMFLGLGDGSSPFKGNLVVSNSTQGASSSIRTIRPFFNNLDTNATITGTLRLGTPNNDTTVTTISVPLLASTVSGETLETPREWNVELIEGGGFGGLIGTLESGSVNLTISGEASLTCSSDAHTGLFCNTMREGTTLTATNSAANITVESTAKGYDAGGFVGRMENGATLTASGNSVASVTSGQGNAGGIVGSAVNATITVSGTGSGNITVSASKNAGGIVGDYVNSKPNAGLDLSNYTTSVTISGGSNAGGVFGALTNNTGTDSAASAYTIRNGSVTITATGSVTNFGGLIGSYGADAMENTLNTTEVTVTATNNDSAASYGGIIGSVGDNSYVEIENLGTVTTAGGAVTNFGGLVGVLGETSTLGAFLNIGSVTLVRESNPSGANAVGGLVGALTAGVVRLHGTTDLSRMTFTGAGGGTGQIVGKNTNGLVYAVGTGNTGDAGWLLKRPPIGRTASDIGNWGQVVRLDSTKLTETDSADSTGNHLFFFDKTGHTVTVLGGSPEITSVRDFASYALHYDFGSTDQAALIFSSEGVAPNTIQTVTINKDIDLTGTGILGIGRDNGTGADGTGKADSNYFTGTICGTGDTLPTIVLDIGCSAFGDGVDKIADPIGNGGLQLFSDGHNYLGLLPVAGGSTKISNLTIDGAVMGNSGSGAKGRVAGAIGYCKADEITFNNVTVSANVSVKGRGSTIYQGGFFGDMVNGNNKSVTFQGSTWSGTLDNSVSGSQIGGFAAYIQNGQKTITVADCTLSGTIKTSAGGDAHVGGLFADFQDGGGNTTVTISDLKVTGSMKVEALSATSCGGFLGYSWPKTNVTFVGTDSGITVSGATLNAPNARFGGLVYQATGYWNATAANSIVFTSGTVETESGTTAKQTEISGVSTEGAPSGLLVGTGLIGQNNALYLEVGTWGAEGAAYYVAPDSVTLTLGGNPATPDSYFDELVGVTIADNKGHNNAVVSLATDGDVIDTDIDNDDADDCTTYTNQTGTNYQNPKTRYYYNLDSYRSGVAANNLTSPGAVLCWSVSQYAASNIRDYFCSGSGGQAIITSTTGLTGYSYYPVSPLSSVSIKGASLTFAKADITTAEGSNKTPDDPNHQHYMMHYGLLYDVSNPVSVSGSSSFSGTVGMDTEGSGALIFGTVTGNTDNPVEISLQGITLKGLRVSGVDSNTTYAPLLINKNLNGGMKLTVDNLGTGVGYSADTPAATSLIGRIGSPDATKLTLEFKNIALDGRKSAGSTSVSNNGKYPVDYGTTKTIFTNATLLESFRYLSDSTGVYNFNSDDNKVTYGYEISVSQRNPGEQYKYYDTDDYAWDGVSSKPTLDTIVGYYTNYLPYVHEHKETDDKYHELDVNLRLVHLAEGCGTYGHPYEITDGKQLEILANYLATGKAYNWVVCVNTVVYGEKCGTAAHDSGNDHYYLCDGEIWYPARKNGEKFEKDTEYGETVDKAGMYAYLRNAYYQINEDITISSSTYMGIGGNVTSGNVANAFSGTILGMAKDGVYPTVYISSQITGAQSFGGLVRYSQGSVIKNLTVSYAGKNVEGEDPIDPASIGMSNSDVPSYTNNPFFGGVVGYCMGGDTIIDNVSVEYGQNSVALSGTDGKDRLIAAGGYVGLVGGAKNKDGYEKTGGGVVFRTAVSAQDASCPNSMAQDNTAYFYCNPYVGRVLDGYACAESCIVNNTDKNYKIPNLDIKNTGLSVSGTDVTVSSDQGLWLLSAIVNSGAGAMDSTGTYRDVDSKLVDAYQYGKPRSGKPSDETYWGGIASKSNSEEAKARVPYLISFTNPDAAKLTGGGAANNSVALTFATGMIDMSTYGNGFRGIGGSYGAKESSNKNCRRSLLIGGIEGKESCSTITLAMEQHDYQYEYAQNAWANQGAGLFTMLNYSATNTEPCVVKNLKLSGNVGVLTYDMSGAEQGIEKKNFDVGVGAFASRTAFSSYQLKFTNFHLSKMNVTGGTSTGGVIGLNQNSGALYFDDWTFKNVTVYKWVNNDGSTGGFVGWHNSGQSLTIMGYGSPSGENQRQWNVDTLSVTVKADKKAYGNVGGLTGANDNNSTVLIDGVNALKLTVTGIAAREVGGLADGGVKTEIKNCWLQDITVSGQASTSGSVGGILGYNNNGSSVIENVTVTGNSSVISDSTYNEGHAGGLVGYVQQSITIKDCSVTGTQDQPIRISNSGNYSAGGLVGRNNNTLKINNCTVENVNLLANKSTAGGLIGKTEGNKSINVSNLTLSNVIAATKGDTYTGLLLGNGNSNTISGYNILAKGSKSGRVMDTNATAEALGTVETDKWKINKAGLWIGNATGTIKLVAVAADGTSSPQKDYSAGGTTTSITYADYPVDQTNQPSGSVSPYLDVNPEGSLTLAGKTYTGNGVGYLDGAQNSIPYKILSEAKTDATSRHYYNVIDSTDFKFSDIVSTDNNNVNSQKNIRLRTFAEYLNLEENQPLTDELSTSGNFPLLVVDNLGGIKVTEAIWNYIAALTNVPSGADAKLQTASVTPTTYYWAGGQFKKAVKSTLTGSGTGFVCSSNAYDNGKMQFTLLDVKYANPTDGKHTGFHLYVPVLVKKIMDAKVDVKILTGTNYYRSDYGGATSHATAGFGEQFTAYITYNYNRSKDEWQNALDDGSPLLWYYEKTLDLFGGKEGSGPLPAGTKMTLVNAQSGQMYYHELAADEENKDTQAAYKLESHFVNSSRQYFASSPVCDLLGITAAEVTEESKNRYVVTEESDATVRIGSTYYRLYDEARDLAPESIFCLTVGEDTVGSDGYLKNPEGYYLTIQVPQKEGTDSINNPLTIWSNNGLGKTENALPVRVSEEKAFMRYVIYDGITSSELTQVATKLIREGNEVNTTVVQNNDTIQVTLSSEIKLSDNNDVKDLFRTRSPAELYHQFSLSLKKSDAEGHLTDWILGAQNIQWEYFVDGESKASDSLNPEEDMEVLTITLGKDKTGLIDKFKNNETVTVKAVITLSYGNNVGTIFPERASNDHLTGLLVHAKSCVAMDYNQLAIATVKSEKDHSARYYCESPSHATMSYDAIEKYGTDGKTLQLGINPLDRYSIGIRAEGTYGYSAVSETTLENAKKIRYTLELFQKQENGEYGKTSMKEISSYLPAPKLVTNQSGGSEEVSFTLADGVYQLEHNFVRADSGNEIIIMDLEPKTGSELETVGGWYANYRVRLTAVMLDSDSNPLSDTLASDYIVYTNAKILQNLVSDTQ